MKRIFAKLFLVTLLAGCLSSCAMTQQQFELAVQTGNVPLAASTVRPGYPNRVIYESNDRYVLPMQYAIAQSNKNMADLLLDHGAFHFIDDRNLAHYSALYGKEDMAAFFVKRGIGQRADISRGTAEKVAMLKRQREQNQNAALMLGALGAMMFGDGGDSGASGRDGTGHTQSEWDTYSSMRQSGQIQ